MPMSVLLISSRPTTMTRSGGRCLCQVCGNWMAMAMLSMWTTSMLGVTTGVPILLMCRTLRTMLAHIVAHSTSPLTGEDRRCIFISDLLPATSWFMWTVGMWAIVRMRRWLLSSTSPRSWSLVSRTS